MLLFLVLHCPFASADFDGVEVVGRRIGSESFVVCRGSACTQFLQSLTALGFYEHLTEDFPIGDAGDTLFCAGLRAGKPSSCGNQEPRLPGYTPGWVGNGCGSEYGGEFEEQITNTLLSQYSQYTGYVDAPLEGFSFLNVCNSHDECWGLGNDFQTCNVQFDTALTNLCDGNAVCLGMRGAYTFAVGTTIAQNNYNSDQQQRACALTGWFRDMQANNCSF